MEKRRKELAFLAVGALLLAGALYTTFKPRAKPAAAEQLKKVAQAPAPQVEETSDSSEASAKQPSAAKQQSAGLRRDPFQGSKASQVAVGSSATGAVKPSAFSGLPTLPPMSIALGPGTGGPPSFGTLPFAGLVGAGMGMPTPSVTTPGTPTTAATAQGAPADNVLRVTGIIEGDPTVAILRQGDARYIVRTGDPVQGYVVESISGRRVVLAAGGQKRSLFLGGRL